MGPDDDGPGSEERMQRIAVWAAVDRLPTRQRAAIYLRYRADLDFSTIAHILGISESGARGDCFRALVSLRERVVRHG
jgi:RNA polymerase sigma factor (sigma-70 family)